MGGGVNPTIHPTFLSDVRSQCRRRQKLGLFSFELGLRDSITFDKPRSGLAERASPIQFWRISDNGIE
jgi:hypothetical protein